MGGLKQSLGGGTALPGLPVATALNGLCVNSDAVKTIA